jgi:hypothetical protein
MVELRLEDFDEHVGERFEVEADGGSLTLELVRAQKLPRLVREGGSFRLEFSGPRDPLLPQAIYRFRGADREFEMFIVPVKQDAAATTYEAIFN